MKMEQISPPTAVGSNAGLGGFFSEADIAASIMSGEQEGRAYRGYCPKCGNFTHGPKLMAWTANVELSR
jgi:hypothetical protein